MYSYQPLSRKPSKSVTSTAQHIYVPVLILKSLGDWLALSLSGSFPASAASPGLANLFSLSPVQQEDLWKVCMLVLFFSVPYLAEPVCATSAVSASMKTALLIRESIRIHRVPHTSEITGILFLKAG